MQHRSDQYAIFRPYAQALTEDPRFAELELNEKASRLREVVQAQFMKGRPQEHWRLFSDAGRDWWMAIAARLVP